MVGAATGAAIGAVILLAMVIGGIIWYKRTHQVLKQGSDFQQAAIIEPFDPYRDFEHISIQAQNLNSTSGLIGNTKTMRNPQHTVNGVDTMSIPTIPGDSSGPGNAGVAAPLGVEELRRALETLMQDQVVEGSEAPPPFYSEPGHH